MPNKIINTKKIYFRWLIIIIFYLLTLKQTSQLYLYAQTSTNNNYTMFSAKEALISTSTIKTIITNILNDLGANNQDNNSNSGLIQELHKTKELSQNLLDLLNYTIKQEHISLNTTNALIYQSYNNTNNNINISDNYNASCPYCIQIPDNQNPLNNFLYNRSIQTQKNIIQTLNSPQTSKDILISIANSLPTKDNKENKEIKDLTITSLKEYKNDIINLYKSLINKDFMGIVTNPTLSINQAITIQQLEDIFDKLITAYYQYKKEKSCDKSCKKLKKKIYSILHKKLELFNKQLHASALIQKKYIENKTNFNGLLKKEKDTLTLNERQDIFIGNIHLFNKIHSIYNLLYKTKIIF